jgi:DNA-binding NarL/FixJ family response regulator
MAVESLACSTHHLYMDAQASVLLLATHTSFRETLCDLLTHRPEMRMVAATDKPHEAVLLASLLEPRLILVDDYRLHGLPDVCTSLVGASPTSRIAVLRSSLVAGHSPDGSMPEVFMISKNLRFNDLADQISQIVGKI